jgi:RsiW-degrading membrane proteinase PrsW (M82 family)
LKRYWILGPDRQAVGPIGADELKRRLSAGAVSPDQLACEVGSESWVSVREVLRGPSGAATHPHPPPLPSSRTGSASADLSGSSGGLNDLASSVAGRIAKATRTEKVEYAEVRSLFSEIFRRHDADEAEAHFGVGLARTTPSLEEIKGHRPRPWFFGRLLLFLGVAFVALSIAWEHFENINVLPGLIITGSFAAPLAMAVFFFECNQPQNISLYVVLKLFVWGGVLGIVLSLILFEVQWPTVIFGASAAALIEEPGKLAAVILLAHRSRYPWTLNGLCFGAAVGAGFAAFESAGYALAIALGEGTDAMTQNLIIRGFLSPFAHVVWTAIAAGALWRVSRGGPLSMESFLNWRFASPFLVVVALHFVWNSSFFDGVPFFGKYLVLGAIAWIVALGLLFGGFREVSRGEVPAS